MALLFASEQQKGGQAKGEEEEEALNLLARLLAR